VKDPEQRKRAIAFVEQLRNIGKQAGIELQEELAERRARKNKTPCFPPAYRQAGLQGGILLNLNLRDKIGAASFRRKRRRKM